MPANAYEGRLEELRLANTAHCAVFLRDHGPASVSEVARATGLSRPTVEGALSDLGARGIVNTDDASGPHRVGRPARVARFRGEAGYLAGIDIGPSEASVIVSDLAGKIVARGRVGLEVAADQVTTLVARMVIDAFREIEAPLHRLIAAHVGITGIVSAASQLLVSGAFPGLVGTDISAQLAVALGCPVELDNDVNLAAVGEQRFGAARHVDDALFVLIGTQISVGLVLDGRLRRGRHDAAGELDASSIRVRLDENGHIVWESASTAREVFALAVGGDEGATDEIRVFASGLADTMHIMIQTIDPELVVIGGPLSREGELLLGPLRGALERRSARPLSAEIVASHLGSASVVYGALARAFDRSSLLVYGVPETPIPVIREAAEASPSSRASLDEAAM